MCPTATGKSVVDATGWPRLHYLTWEEARELAISKKGVLLPVGSVEQHGPHLPLSTDLLIAEEVSIRVAGKTGLPIAPSLPFGVSLEHERFPGTISVRPNTMMRVAIDILRSLMRLGFNYVFIINGHAGNSGILDSISRYAKARLGLSVYVFNVQEMFAREAVRLNASSGLREHAGAIETSVVLYVRSELVRAGRVNRARFTTGKQPKSLPPGIATYGWRVDDYSLDGVVGDPSKASSDLGRELFNNTVEYITSVVKSVMNEIG